MLYFCLGLLCYTVILLFRHYVLYSCLELRLQYCVMWIHPVFSTVYSQQWSTFILKCFLRALSVDIMSMLMYPSRLKRSVSASVTRRQCVWLCSRWPSRGPRERLWHFLHWSSTTKMAASTIQYACVKTSFPCIEWPYPKCART